MSFNFLNPKYLCITSAAMTIPLAFHMNKVVFKFVMDKGDVPLFERTLGASLFVAIMTSQWFWSNPVRGSMAHKVDKLVSKTSIMMFIFYTIFLKGLPRRMLRMYFLLVLIFFGFASASHYYSSKEWCSKKHLICHGGSHLVGFVSVFYTFIWRQSLKPCKKNRPIL